MPVATQFRPFPGRVLLAGVSAAALAAGALAVGVVASDRAARADTTGYNNFVTLNPDGGDTANDGLRVVVSSGAYGIWRNGNQQVYGAPNAARLAEGSNPLNGIILFIGDDTVVTYANGTSGGPTTEPEFGRYAEDVHDMTWSLAETTLVTSGTGGLWEAETVLVADVTGDGSLDDTLTVTTSYRVGDDTIGLEYALDKSLSVDYRIYHAVDTYLDGSDYGPGTTSVVGGKRVVAQFNESGVGGFREAGTTTFASFVEARYNCTYGGSDEICPDSPYGPHDGTRYPNTVDPRTDTDAGVGIELDMGNTAGSVTATSEFYFAALPGTIQGRFAEPAVSPTGDDTLIITLASPAGVTSTGLGFTVTIPQGSRGVRTQAIPGTPTCSGATIVRGVGSGSVDDSVQISGVTLSGGQTCTILIPLTGFNSLAGVDYAITPADVSGIAGSPTPLVDINDQITVEGARYGPDNPKTINNAGGTPGTGMKISYGAGQIQITRNTVGQLYSPEYTPQRYIEPDLFNGYFLLVDDTLVGTKSAWPDDDTGWVGYGPVQAIVNWDNVTASGGSSRGSGTITSVLTYNAPGGQTYTLTAELIYDIASPDSIQERLTLSVPNDHTQDDTVKLYRGMDTYLNGSDFGTGFADDSTTGAPRQIGARSSDGAVQQWLQARDDTLWDGWYANTFACPVNPDYDDAEYGSCLSRDDSEVSAIVAGGNLWDDTASATIASARTDMSLAVMWDVDDTTGTYTYDYDIKFADRAATPVWQTTALPPMTVGSPIDTFFVALPGTGATAIDGYDPVEGSLPSGLYLDRISGEVVGTPTSPGSYTIIMQAVNNLGGSAYRTFTGTVAAQPTPATPPGPPRDVTGIPGDGQVTVSWDPPTDSGSYPITSYRVVAEPGGQSCLVSAPTTTCVITGLTNGTPYVFTVEALNGAGWGEPGRSDPVTPVGPPAPTPEPPGPVRKLQVVKVTAGGVAVIRWRVPLDDGGAPVTSYRVGYRLVTSKKYTRVRPNPTTTRVRITGLEPGRKYWVRVRAVNIAGEGPGRRTERFLIP